MARRGSSVADAEAEVVRLEEAAERWRSEAAVKSADLNALTSSHGDSVLGGADPRELHAKAEDLRILIAGALSAAESADRKLFGARAAVVRAQGLEVQQRADVAIRERDEHARKLQVLLSQLSELEGVDYAWVGPPEGATSWLVPQSAVLDDAAQALADEAAARRAQAEDVELGVDRPLSTYMPAPALTGTIVSVRGW